MHRKKIIFEDVHVDVIILEIRVLHYKTKIEGSWTMAFFLAEKKEYCHMSYIWIPSLL